MISGRNPFHQGVSSPQVSVWRPLSFNTAFYLSVSSHRLFTRRVQMIWLSVVVVFFLEFASEAFSCLVQTPGPGQRHTQDLDGPSESLLIELECDCDVCLSTVQNR